MLGRPRNIFETVKAKYVMPEPMSGCWLWIGTMLGGYGVIRRVIGTKLFTVKAHRWFYEHYKGEIPDGLTIDHLCRNTACVNPKHLEAVTGRVNTMRGFGAAALNLRKKVCIRGHEFRQLSNRRYCPTCKLDKQSNRVKLLYKKDFMPHEFVKYNHCRNCYREYARRKAIIYRLNNMEVYNEIHN